MPAARCWGSGAVCVASGRLKSLPARRWTREHLERPPGLLSLAHVCTPVPGTSRPARGQVSLQAAPESQVAPRARGQALLGLLASPGGVAGARTLERVLLGDIGPTGPAAP